MKSKLLATCIAGAVLGLTLAGSVLAAQSDTILWKENFDTYKAGDKPILYHEGKGEVLEENGKIFYRVPREGGFMGGNAYYGSRHWRNCELRFQMRPQGTFTLRVVVNTGGWRGPTPYMWYYMPITNDSVAPYAHGLPADVKHTVPAEKITPPLEAGKWYDMRVRATGNRIQIFAAEDGKERALWDHEVLPGGGGIDFHGGGVDLDNIVVEELP